MGLQSNNQSILSLNIPSILQRLAEIEVQLTLDFLTLNRNKQIAVMTELSKSPPDEPDLIEVAADTKLHLDELLFFAEQSAVLALYRIVELNSVKIAEWRWGANMVKTKQLFRADKLESEITSQLQLDIKSLPGYCSVDELRLLNNAIKHEGVVSNKLAKYPGWTAGSPFTNLDLFIHRVAPALPMYLRALAIEVVPMHKKPPGV